ncbi:enoyl-CoA hydratase/isomerase family protein [uncultured Cohaesibacter sp.]|uniref:enoyl-CoA hydratase/isomerase family protein n=1 Tax=uncultured Cohaesibacter sp. TaxID=1002546 RepID=UPI0029C93CA8|nr:enoyl-CoA hydratase/isomerase family protein [uncultured Cohaesibacter sp.]
MTDTQNSDKILIERSGAIGRIVINNEAKRNAVTLAMWQAIPSALRELDADPAIHVIVLEGRGDKAFVSGADISEFDTVRKDTPFGSPLRRRQCRMLPRGPAGIQTNHRAHQGLLHGRRLRLGGSLRPAPLQ